VWKESLGTTNCPPFFLACGRRLEWIVRDQAYGLLAVSQS
jgi:hypothetical protein